MKSIKSNQIYGLYDTGPGTQVIGTLPDERRNSFRDSAGNTSRPSSNLQEQEPGSGKPRRLSMCEEMQGGDGTTKRKSIVGVRNSV